MAFTIIEPRPMARDLGSAGYLHFKSNNTKFNLYKMGFLIPMLIGSFSLHNRPSTYPKSIILTKGRRIAIIEEITTKFVQKVPRNSNEAEIKHLGELEHGKASMLRCGGLGHKIQCLSRISSPKPCLGTSARTVTCFSCRTTTKINSYEMGFLFPPSLWLRLSSCMAIKPFFMDPITA